MTFDVASLNRWQRTRVVALALGCGANFHNNDDISSHSSSSTSFTACNSCGTTSQHEITIPFASPTRSLVDKHFDALAQTMSEVGIEWNVESSQAGSSSNDLNVKFSPLVVEDDKKNDDGLCFLCSFARACNSERCNAKTTNNEPQLSSSSSTPWWMSEKHLPEYVNMETGDVGAIDPQDEYIAKTLQSWGENCRYVVTSVGSRLAKIVLKQEKRTSFFTHDDEDELSDEELLKQQLEAEQQSDRLVAVSKFFDSENYFSTFTVSLSGEIVSVSVDDKKPAGGHFFNGFNRTRVVLVENNEEEFHKLMSSPLSYASFLVETFAKMTSAICRFAIFRQSGQNEHLDALAACLTAAVFSDARRRQFSGAANHNSNSSFMMTTSMPMMMEPPGPTQPTATANNVLAMVMAGRKSAPPQPQQNGETEPVELPSSSSSSSPSTATTDTSNGVDATVQAVLAKIEQQKRMMTMTMMTATTTNCSFQQNQQQGFAAPPPPFLIPFSFLEEMMVMMERKKEEKIEEDEAKDGGTVLALYSHLAKLRNRVELEDHDEEEMTNPEFEKPTYIGEFGNILRKIVSTP